MTLKDKVIKNCIHCKKELTDQEIENGLKPFIRHEKIHLELSGRIALWCSECLEKVKKGEIKPF